MLRGIFSICLLFLGLNLFAQESKLAQQYFLDAEFEKAAVLYKKLYNDNNGNDYYFNRYIDCLSEMEAYDEAEKELKLALKKTPKMVQLYVTYGGMLEKQGRQDDADEQYSKAIKKMPADRFIVVKLANAFTSLAKYEFAVETFTAGSKLLNSSQIFSYNLGDLYRRKGEPDKMVESYLNSLEGSPTRLRSIQTLFQRYLGEDDYGELQAQLYERIQSDPKATAYVELLSWTFIQQNDYASALQQNKALDLRLGENGARPFQLAGIAYEAGDFETAIAGYDYVIQKGPASSFYIEAKKELLATKRQELTETLDYTEEQLRSLELEYQQFLEEFGKSRITAKIVAELADLEAYYLNDLDIAIDLLLGLIEYPGLQPLTLANGKISLADYYLMKGEVWEATLLYSQVDKAFEEDLVGHQARFKNAKLAYFNGDFEWAQAQFDVLKASTSKLIANDALDLSIFILDNTGLDTTTIALEKYAKADLLIFQNKFKDAQIKLDSIRSEFPGHSLEDDVLYSEAGMAMRKRKYLEASKIYEKIVENHSDEIRADNALIKLAELQEIHLNDKDAAKANYEKLFIEYSGSTFAVEARKRYRKLRGDEL